MRQFEIADAGTTFVAALSTPERLVLAQVTGDVVELLGGEDLVEVEPEQDETPDQTAGEDEGAEDGAAQDPELQEGDTQPAAEQTEAEAESEAQLRQLLAGIDADADVVAAPADPAVRRLLPDASDDPEVAHEFRRLTDEDLRQRKVDRLLLFAELLLEASPSSDEDEQLPMVVARDDGPEVAGALGDVRQVIGSRLGLRTDADTDALYRSVSATWEDHVPEDEDGDDPAGPAAGRGHAGEALSGPELFLGSVFLLAGYLQESLTDCLLEQHRRASRPS
ncbi:hypothetical protein Sked_25080 [Sanguibacter keddieii DSM 10542]|uniref:Uncharacterized protein n=1 Tax=Sanguibacter keddieii (strain ATCC 51767 / DSM 10542 / NCFB 3025 / ST-74) TaxID=446469 RepID=D1BK04_SANKS|nr:DUF2017 family protein [Sanguibacter keddieii]ACZ22413.1 hypothetical protein Sked_25080 [Sanguibacter keddieii DSM 10542]